MSRSFDDADDDMPEWDSLEFAEQYGYGATTSQDMPMNQGADEEWVDPNADYVATMSETEQQAFYEALYGAQSMSEEPIDEEDRRGRTSRSTTGRPPAARARPSTRSTRPASSGTTRSSRTSRTRCSELYEDAQTDERTSPGVREVGAVHGRRGLRLRQPAGGAGQHLRPDQRDPVRRGDRRRRTQAALAEITGAGDRDGRRRPHLPGQHRRGSRGSRRRSSTIEQEFIDAHKDELDAMVEKAAQATEVSRAGAVDDGPRPPHV